MADTLDATAVLPAGSLPVPESTSPATRKSDSRKPVAFSRDRRVDRFELIRELARGGMGQVFLARDTKLGRKVALKFLLYDDPDFVQRFVVEARATARCTHENIVTIFEVGEHEGLPYMVLEYLEGKPFSKVLQGHPSLTHVTEVMVHVARALERAHEHGIVHRDLTPNNIFVTDRGQVKVLDFGVARLVDRAAGLAASADRLAEAFDVRASDVERMDSSSVVTSNSLVGTVAFMSPEQWGADLVDHLSDIWAMGIMLWRALIGAHPAGTMEPKRLREQLIDLATPLPSIAVADPTIPRELALIVDKCLAKRKCDRYQSATELRADMQAFLTPAATDTSGEVCPYRGLAAFRQDDAKYFFGRSNEIRTAVAHLDGWPLLAVIGPTGVGKSSFVNAGLVPAVRATGNWQVCMLRPGRTPLPRLVNVLEEALATGEHASDLLTKLVDAPGLFGSLLRITAARRNQKILVVVDQLEELFTLCDNDEIRRLFLAALLAAGDDPSSPVRVVLSMRADFLDRLAGHKQFLTELSRGLFFLTAPDDNNLREALVRPAELAGYAFEDSIADDMMQVATSRSALPLLSFAATQLWAGRDRANRRMTATAYRQMGGVGGAFARHADQIVAAVPPQDQILLRAIMIRLVTPDGTRAVVDRKELLSLSNDPQDVDDILDHLVRARLIHLQTDVDQTVTVEIVHEMLITEWPTLKRWLDDIHAMRGFMHELQHVARLWASRDKPSDLVWHGATAREALAHVSRHVFDLSAIEKAFLAAVRDQVARSRRRKMLVFASIFSALGLVLAGATVAAVRIKLAEREAGEKAEQAVTALREAEAAKGQLEGKLEVIEEKEKARKLAERRAEDAASAMNKAEAMSKAQLEAANQELHRKVLEAQAAKEKAEQAEVLARRSSAEAREATSRTEQLLANEHAALEKLKAEKKSIFDGDLTAP